MSSATAIETERLRVQESLDEERSQRERNETGQFATPPALAEDIIASLLDAGLPESIDFLEPSCGSGSFYSALLRLAGGERIDFARGVELDERFAAAAKRLWGETGLEVEAADFTQWSEDTGERFDLLVANPPYVRHHYLCAKQKKRLVARATSELRLKPSGLSGLYVHFILASHRVLRPGAISAWLIPTEFMDVNYGSVLRTYLSRNVTLLQIHTFDAADVQFADALVSSAVVVFRNTPPTRGDKASFTFGGSVTRPREEHIIPIVDLDPRSKWSSMPDRGSLTDTGPTLGDFFTIRRGIATGANGFFILDRSDATERGFAERHLTPMLPSPRYIRGVTIDADDEGWPILDRRLTLLDCHVPEAELASVDPALAEYFATADELGIKDGYLVKTRKPWYRQEKRAPAPFLCTYMGRGVDKDRPFRFILNRSRAVATNMYLMLYPSEALAQYLDQDPAHMEAVHAALLSLTAEELRRGGRVYGGGLHKIEPKELASLPAHGLVELAPKLQVRANGAGQLPLVLT